MHNYFTPVTFILWDNWCSCPVAWYSHVAQYTFCIFWLLRLFCPPSSPLPSLILHLLFFFFVALAVMFAPSLKSLWTYSSISDMFMSISSFECFLHFSRTSFSPAVFYSCLAWTYFLCSPIFCTSLPSSKTAYWSSLHLNNFFSRSLLSFPLCTPTIFLTLLVEIFSESLILICQNLVHTSH